MIAPAARRHAAISPNAAAVPPGAPLPGKGHPVVMRRASSSRPSTRRAALSPFAALLLFLATLLMSSGVFALELVMYDKPGCVWCARFERDIGRRYPSFDMGRIAPLRRVDIHDQRRSGVDLEEPVIYTPTFVLTDDDGAEIGRITGYQGAEGFWGNLADMLRDDRRRGR
jgi:hypothetical protein